MKHKLNRFKLA